MSQVNETLPGDDVIVEAPYNSVTIQFDNVSEGGSTSVVVTDEPLAPITGFEFLGQYYDISTEATYSGNVTITINYDDTGMAQEEEDTLRLFHWNGSDWEDVTVLPVDTASNLITGLVESLSWFAIGLPEVTWLPPLSTTEVYLAQDGSTVPIKFQLTYANGHLVTDTSVVVTVTRDSDGSIVLSGIATYEPDIQGYIINAQTKE